MTQRLLDAAIPALFCTVLSALLFWEKSWICMVGCGIGIVASIIHDVILDIRANRAIRCDGGMPEESEEE